MNIYPCICRGLEVYSIDMMRLTQSSTWQLIWKLSRYMQGNTYLWPCPLKYMCINIHGVKGPIPLTILEWWCRNYGTPNSGILTSSRTNYVQPWRWANLGQLSIGYDELRPQWRLQIQHRLLAAWCPINSHLRGYYMSLLKSGWCWLEGIWIVIFKLNIWTFEYTQV